MGVGVGLHPGLLRVIPGSRIIPGSAQGMNDTGALCTAKLSRLSYGSGPHQFTFYHTTLPSKSRATPQSSYLTTWVAFLLFLWTLSGSLHSQITRFPVSRKHSLQAVPWCGSVTVVVHSLYSSATVEQEHFLGEMGEWGYQSELKVLAAPPTMPI